MRKRGPRSWPSLTADPATRAGHAFKRLEDITRLVSDLVWETGPDMRLVFVSENALEVFGLLPVQMEGRRMTDMGRFHNGSGSDVQLHQHRPFRDVAFRLDGAGSRHRDFLVSGLPFFDDESGNFLGFRGTARDVTELLRAEKMRREQEERQRAIVADVAHELRTPLAILRTKLENLEDETVSASLREDVDSMTRLVSQMMAFARYELFRPKDGDAANLGMICTTVATYMAPIALRSDRSIEVVMEKDPVIVPGSAPAIEQAVRNLVENAVQHAPPRSTVTVKVTGEPAVHVRDRGAGVPMNRRDRIFRRFDRADRLGEGAGLGLAIVKRIVDAHNASVEVLDAPGGGADFCIRFSEIRAT